MDYKWIKTAEEGQNASGYINIFETNAKNINIRSIVNYFPKLNQFGNNKICSVIVMYACTDQDMTKGFFRSINDDILELIQEQESEKFDKTSDKFKIMMTQQFFVDKLPKMEYYTHGDYSVPDNW